MSMNARVRRLLSGESVANFFRTAASSSENSVWRTEPRRMWSGVDSRAVQSRRNTSRLGIAMILDESCQAQKYSIRLSKETRKGLLVNAENAVHNGGKVPYGFRLGYEGKLKIDELKSPAVKKIFEMYASGMSYRQIIKWLDKNKFKTVNNRSFSPSTIKSMLANEKYCGTYFWDKTAAKDYRGKRNSYKKKDSYIQIENGCPAIVSKELFQKAQKRLNDNKTKIGNYNSKNYYPMNGKIYCDKCGTKLNGKVQYSRTNKGNKPTKQYRFNCACSDVKTLNQTYLDDMIVYALRECLFSPVNQDELMTRLNAYAEQQNKSTQMQLDILQEEKAALVKKQQKLLPLVEQDIAPASVLERLKELEAESSEIDVKTKELISSVVCFTDDDLKEIKREFVRYVMEECNEDTIAALNDTISQVRVGDTITVGFKDGIRVSRETKMNFN